MMLLEVIWGARDLSTIMEMPTLILCERPIGMPGFQKEAPFHNSIPLVEVRHSTSPKWCSCNSRIWGGVAKEETHVLISFGFGEFFLKLLTFRDAMVVDFLFI